MAEIRFEYEDVPGFVVSPGNLIDIIAPRESVTMGSGWESGQGRGHYEEEIIKSALRDPIGSPRLKEMASSRSRILVIVDDMTRLTPVNRILPYVLGELTKSGVREENIKILVALGTHRPMSCNELDLKLGVGVRDRFRVINHDSRNTSSLVYCGKTSCGTEVWLNREVRDADLVIGIGMIVPHRVAGFSGGSKIIQPGISGDLTTGQTHWQSALYPGEEIMGKVDNPVREEMDEVARRAGLKFIVNAILDRMGRMVYVVAGDPMYAFRKGTEFSRAIYGVEVREKADIVITESYPADLELWQGAKGIYASELVVKEGGVVILVSPCPEGVAAQHPEVERHGYKSLEEVKKLIARNEIPDLAVAAHLVLVGRVIVEKARGILVSSGLSDARRVEALGFLPAKTPQEALELAYSLKGKDARVLVMKHGGEMLPITGSRSSSRVGPGL